MNAKEICGLIILLVLISLIVLGIIAGGFIKTMLVLIGGTAYWFLMAAILSIPYYINRKYKKDGN